jgi:tetratricopeptide (TPR) repeat protein
MKWAILIVAIVSVFAAYAPALDGAFVWDDHVLVEHDARCKADLVHCFSIPFLPQSPFLDVSPAYYRPIVTASFAILDGARTQHLFNVLLHASNACLLFALMSRHGVSAARALAASVVWALHPRLVEGVAWVSGRTDVLCATFVFAALLAWPPRDADNKQRVILALVFVFLGLVTKEVAVAAILALGVTAPKRRLVLLAAPVAAYAMLRLAVVGTHVPPSSLTPSQRLPTVLEAIGRYADMTAHFSSPWSARGAIGVLSTPYAVAGALMSAALVVLMWRAARSKHDGILLGTALGGGCLLAVVHIVPIGLHGAVAGDRLLYLPLAGALLAVVCALPTFRFEPLALGATFAFACVEGFYARRTVHAFDDELGLWLTLAERADPANAGPRSALATVVRDRGVPEVACPLFDSARRALETRRTTPSYRRASENLAACWSAIGRYDESAALYAEIAREHPDAGRVWLGLGYAELHRLDFDAAKAAFVRATMLDPALLPLATKMREEVEHAAKQRGELDADPVRRARYLASVGRAVEAEREWLLVARDEGAPRALRIEALRYLAEDGSPEAAAAALDAVREHAFAERIGQRHALAQTVVDQRERILRAGP